MGTKHSGFVLLVAAAMVGQAACFDWRVEVRSEVDGGNGDGDGDGDGDVDGGTAWFDTNYQTRRPIIIDNVGRAALAGFPVAIKNLNVGAHFDAEGAGLRFVADDHATVLPFEIEKGSAIDPFWVRTDLAANAETRIWAYYDAINRTNVASGAAVFADYGIVHHLADSFGIADLFEDSSPNQIDLNWDNIDSSDQVAAAVGLGLDFQVGSNAIAASINAGTALEVPNNGARTYEAWFRTSGGIDDMSVLDNTDSTDGAAIRVLQTGRVEASFDSNGTRRSTSSAQPFDDNLWHHAALVVDRGNTSLTLLVDGVIRGTATGVNAVGGPAGPLIVGQALGGASRQIDGVVDEVRVGPAQGPDWFAATYATIELDGVRIGAEETIKIISRAP